MSTDPLQLLSVTDVAELFNVTPDWVYDQVEAGRFPAVRVGRMLRFRRHALERYLAEREFGG